MGFIKNIARKILADEIWNYEDKIRELKSEAISLESRKSREILHWTEETKKTLEEKCKLEKENEILRKYYDLDKEPSEEIKTKIHIDLEIDRLKEENLKLIAMRSQVNYMPVPMPYLSYGLGRGII